MAQSRSGGSKGRASQTGSKTTAKSRSSSTSRSRSSAKAPARGASARSATAKKGGQRRAASSKPASRAASDAGVEAKTVAEFRDALRKNLMKPMEMVLLSRERIEEVLAEAVDQGRINARDAQRVTSGLVKRGQKQTSDVLKDLEQLLGRGREEIGGRAAGARKAAKRSAGAAKGARRRAVRQASPALARVDKVRRGAGVGASFPVTGYDDLTASQIQRRLTDLTPAQLRKVRDHERRNANRKTVLNAIESKLV